MAGGIDVSRDEVTVVEVVGEIEICVVELSSSNVAIGIRGCFFVVADTYIECGAAGFVISALDIGRIDEGTVVGVGGEGTSIVKAYDSTGAGKVALLDGDGRADDITSLDSTA